MLSIRIFIRCLGPTVILDGKFSIAHKCYAEKMDLKPKPTHILYFSCLLAYSFFLLILGDCATYQPVAVNKVPFKQHSSGADICFSVKISRALFQ